MFYKPKYCSNCGEKIERATPSLTDSNRFCDVCQHDFVVQRSLPKIFAGLMAVFGLFGLGSYWRSGEKMPAPATRQFIQTVSDSGKNAVKNSSPDSVNTNLQPPTAAGNVQANAPQNLTNKPIAKQTAARAAATDEAVYFCGAATKKGTPCSRRVRGGGRCWQHQGQDAMLPSEKLLVSR